MPHHITKSTSMQASEISSLQDFFKRRLADSLTRLDEIDKVITISSVSGRFAPTIE